jgi:CRP-like cAMP-binding protein
MPADMAKTVIGCMRPRTFVKGQVVVQHNSVGSSIFFVDYGQLQASLNGKVLEEIRPGAVYGELAFIGACRKLLIEAPDVKDWSVLLRSCRITSVSDCRCFELTTNDFLAAMRKAGYSAQDVTKVDPCPSSTSAL